MEESTNERYVSHATPWEVAIITCDSQSAAYGVPLLW